MTDYKIIKTRIIDMLTDSECEDKRLLEYIYQELQNEGIGWIPVSERLPEVEQRIIYYARGWGIYYGYLDNDYSWWWADFKNEPNWSYGRITHWQTLPSGPKEAT